MEIHQQQVAGQSDQAAAATVQLLRALHQLAIDNGDWCIASKLLAHRDPLEKREFGGSEQQLQAIHAYERALAELKPKQQNQNNTNKDHGGAENDKDGKGKGAGKGKGKGLEENHGLAQP